MAYGSMRQMRRYAEKVFAKEARLAQMTDGRSHPTLPLSTVLSTWQWGLVRLDRTDRRSAGGPALAGAPGSAAGAGREPGPSGLLDGLSTQEWQQMMLEDFFLARRAGIVTDDGLYGKRYAVSELNELFKSETIHCPQCQAREKTIQDEKGEKRIVPEYYHQVVALTWVSGPIPCVIGWEVLAPGEGELTATLRLLERLLPAWGRVSIWSWAMGSIAAGHFSRPSAERAWTAR